MGWFNHQLDYEFWLWNLPPLTFKAISSLDGVPKGSCFVQRLIKAVFKFHKSYAPWLFVETKAHTKKTACSSEMDIWGWKNDDRSPSSFMDKSCPWFFSGDTLPETNIAPENRPSQKEPKYSNHPFSGAKMLVSGRVYSWLCLRWLFTTCTHGKSPLNHYLTDAFPEFS